MNPGVAFRNGLERLSRANAQQVVLRAVAGGLGFGFLGVIPLAGGDFHPLMSAALLALVVITVVLPDSGAPLFLVLGLGALWAISVPGVLTWWTLLAAAVLFAMHLACTLASYGPPQLVLGRALLMVWSGRAAVALAVTALVWAGSRFLAALELPASGWAMGLALGVLLAWLGFLWVRLVTRDAAPPT